MIVTSTTSQNAYLCRIKIRPKAVFEVLAVLQCHNRPTRKAKNNDNGSIVTHNVPVTAILGCCECLIYNFYKLHTKGPLLWRDLGSPKFHSQLFLEGLGLVLSPASLAAERNKPPPGTTGSCAWASLLLLASTLQPRQTVLVGVHHVGRVATKQQGLHLHRKNWTAKHLEVQNVFSPCQRTLL